MPLALTDPGRMTFFQLSKEERLMNTIVSPTRHMAELTKLKCHDEGFHACDVVAVEELGVWDLVFPRHSKDFSEACGTVPAS